MVISQIRHSGGLGHEIWYIAFAPFENLALLGLEGLKENETLLKIILLLKEYVDFLIHTKNKS